MKKIATLILFVCAFIFYGKAQIEINNADLEGNWTLSALEGNDTAVVLSPEQIQASTANYEHDFPLTTSTLNITSTDFTMTHHTSGTLSGTWEVAYDNNGTPVLVLHSSCSTCPPKDYIFYVRSISSSELILDIFDEDEGTSTYAHLTYNK